MRKYENPRWRTAAILKIENTRKLGPWWFDRHKCLHFYLRIVNVGLDTVASLILYNYYENKKRQNGGRPPF